MISVTYDFPYLWDTVYVLVRELHHNYRTIKGGIIMNHFNLSDLESNINIRGVHAKTVVNHKNTTIKKLILNPGEAIGAHQVNVDVTFFVLEGEGAITIGDTTYQVVKNDVVLCPPATPMSIQASNEVGLSFLNIKTPGI